MRWRVIAWGSLGVNGVLVAFLLLALHYPLKGRLVAAAAVTDGAAESGATATNLVVRRQLFAWQELESADYPTYIASLRSIGCPEQTIRDIIIADVNALYARRRATEILTPAQQWWRVSPDTNILRVAQQKSHELDAERRELLARLLGPNWEMGDLVALPRPSRPGLVLDGSVLGAMSIDAKQAIQEVNVRSQERLQAYLEQVRGQGKEPDPAELAKLRQATRTELEGLMNPAQLEEFLLRYSQEANDLRSDFGQLQYFSPTPDEFRAVFRATDTIDQQLQALTGNDPNTEAQRKALQDARDNAIKIALGPDRYDEYQALEDPVYRAAMAQAIAAGTPDAVQSIYEINLAALSEQQDILGNTNLTDVQKQIQLKQLQLDQLKANTVATGQDLPPDSEPQPQAPPPRKLVVGPGDNAQTIALMYGMPLSVLSAANPGVDLSQIRPGDSVVIPRLPLPPFRGPDSPQPLPPPPQSP